MTQAKAQIKECQALDSFHGRFSVEWSLRQRSTLDVDKAGG